MPVPKKVGVTLSMREDMVERIDVVALSAFDGIRTQAVLEAIGVYFLVRDTWGADFDRRVAEMRLAAMPVPVPSLRDRVRAAPQA